jgi:lipopolysaccharide export system protein LptA
MLRGKLLSAGKLLALALLFSIVAALVVYLARTRRVLPAGDGKPQLQKGKIGVGYNTHYVYEAAGRVRFKLDAGVDTSYEDGTHELEQVRLESNGVKGDRTDIVTADRAKISDTSDLNRLDAEFISNVRVVTGEGLTVKTEYLKYNQTNNTAETDKPVAFERKNMHGTATGMLVEATDERVHLLKEVDVTVEPQDKNTDGAPGPQDPPNSGTTRNAPKPSSAGGKIKAPVHITGQTALLEKKEHRVTFQGSVVVTQKNDEMRSDKMIGYLDDDNQHIEKIEARGNSDLKETDQSEIQSPDMDFFFADAQRLDHALATGGVYARSLGGEPLREARSDTAEVTFKQNASALNVADTVKASGHASLHVHAPAAAANSQKNPAERDIKGDEITMAFFDDGKTLKTAEATGNAVLVVTPTIAARGADKKTIQAPQMKALFFDEGNRIKTYEAAGGVRVELDALVEGAHPPRVTTSKRLQATFQPDSQDIDRTIQEGDFKYSEGDRNGVADRAVYDGQREFLTLRGKRPMGWDSKSRLQADEIDYDRDKDEMHARGDVRTTYFNREATAGSTPFNKKSKSPTYMTAERVDERGDDSVAVYTGNARGWQDDNFVKADRIELYKDENRMVAVGHVESALYTIERETSPGHREIVPAFASADQMTYSDDQRLVHYEGHVKSRQGTDRIDADRVDTFLKQDTSEVDHLIATGGVDLTQPGRHGVGDKLTYTSDDGRGVLVGKNARVDDDEKGSVMGSELTFYNGDDKITVDNQRGAARVRSIHRMEKKVKEKQ